MKNEYFLAIPMPKGAADRLWQLQTEAQKILHEQGIDVSISQGRSPLHLTLVPRFVPKSEAEEQVVLDGLRVLGYGTAFSFTLCGFDAFDANTVCAKVRPECHYRLSLMRNAALLNLGRGNDQHYTPHVSLARNFNVDHFEAIQGAFRRAPIHAFPMEIQVTELTLYALKRNGWEPHATVQLARERVA